MDKLKLFQFNILSTIYPDFYHIENNIANDLNNQTRGSL